MGLECGKLYQIPPVARTETMFLDIWGNPTKPEHATRVVTREFDAKGNYLSARITIDYRRVKY